MLLSQHLSAPSSKTTRHESRSMESPSAEQHPVNLDPEGPSVEAELPEPVPQLMWIVQRLLSRK